MKMTFISLLLLAGLLLGLAGGAGAVPIDFDIDGDGAQVSISWTVGGSIA